MPASTGGGGGRTARRRQILKGYIDGQYRNGFQSSARLQRAPMRGTLRAQQRYTRPTIDGGPARIGKKRTPSKGPLRTYVKSRSKATRS